MGRKLYTSGAVQQAANLYTERGGIVYTLEEGVLGWGLTVMVAPGLYTAVVREVPLNEWSSAHVVRQYRETPKKYAAMIEAYEDKLSEEDLNYEVV